MCLDNSDEVAAALAAPPAPVVITETDGIRVDFYDPSQDIEAFELLVNAAIKHGKPIKFVLRTDPAMTMSVKWA